MDIKGFFERLIYWLFFGLALAILPVLITFTIIMLQHPAYTLFHGWAESISKGELLIISSALLGINLGDLSREPPAPSFRLFHFFLIGVSVVLAMFTVAVYVFISTTSKPPDSEVLANLSGALLILTSGICVFSFFVE